MNKLQFKDNFLIIDNLIFHLNHIIRDARLIDNKAVVIFKYDDSVPRHSQFNNLHAFNQKGELIWKAEHPTNETADFYLDFISPESNKLWNFGCFICEIDFNTGKLLTAEFTK